MDTDLQALVVLITSSDLSNRRFGTGFVIHRDEQATYLLTCAHVVDDVGGAETIDIGGLKAAIVAIGDADALDLAVLRVEGSQDKSPLSLRASGEKDTAFRTAGFQLFGTHYLIRPLQGKLGQSVGLTMRGHAGYIKAWDLKIEDDYQLQPGYSGSPVVNEHSGEVLGIVSHRQGQGERGLAISIEALPNIWPDMPPNLLLQPDDSPATIPQPPDTSGDSFKQKRRFEAAMPQSTQMGQETEVRVMVALSDSQGLRAHLPDWTETGDLIAKEDVVQNEVRLKFPVDSGNLPLDIDLSVKITAPDFEVGPAKKISISPEYDSAVVTFLLTPTRTDERAYVLVELLQDSTVLGSLTLMTTVKSQDSDLARTIWQIVSLPLNMARDLSSGKPAAPKPFPPEPVEPAPSLEVQISQYEQPKPSEPPAEPPLPPLEGDQEMSKPIAIFFSYAHEDEELRDELAKHLSILRRQGTITAWHDREITAGSEWAGAIDDHLNSADIILLLISSDFMASDYCYDVEMTRALERHEAREAVVIPVILRSTKWASAPFGKLQALPRNAKPVTAWPDRDEAFLNITEGILAVVQKMRA